MPKLTKIYQIQFTLPQLLHLSSNRRVHNLPLYFQFTTPAREFTHRMKFILPRKTRILETPCFFTTLGQRNTKNPTQKDTNFGNTKILCYLEPENHQIQPRKTRISYKTALIDPSKMPRKVFSFPEFRASLSMHSLIPTTLTKQQLGNT